MSTDLRLRARVARACLVRGPVTLRSGETSDVYVDKWKIITDPLLFGQITNDLFGEIPAPCSLVAGPELGGAVVATAIAAQTAMPFLVVRRASKQYGTSRRIEGIYEPGEVVCLIEDVLTTGRTALDAALALRAAGLVVDTCVAVVDRQAGATELLAAHGVTVRALWTLDDLLAADDDAARAREP